MPGNAEVAIGIDLGTTYSCVAVWQNNRVEIIANDQGQRLTPSCVAFTNTERLIGSGGEYQMSSNPTNTIFEAKRLMGKRFGDEELQKDIKNWPFKVVASPCVDDDAKPMFAVTYKEEAKKFSPEEISSMILGNLKEIAEKFIGSPVKSAVITVPAYFNDSQRQATKDAGTIAGLNVIRILNEPTAAAIAYGLDSKGYDGTETNVLIFDLGGGTFDVSVVTIDSGNFKVKAVGGHDHLGGVDFDRKMVEHFIEELKKKYNKDIEGNNRVVSRLRIACEKAKRNISASAETQFEINIDGTDDIQLKMSRAKFENLNMDFFDTCIKQVESCMADAKMEKSDIHEVVLVGGSTRIPKLRQMLQDFFEGKKLCHALHPDEAVAYGAGMQAAILSGVYNATEFTLEDVTPLSLGIELHLGEMKVIVPRNTATPTRMDVRVATAFDNQQVVSFIVYEGERPKARDNNLLGSFNLTGIPPAPKRSHNFTVTCNIDIDGILTVTATHDGFDQMNQIKITNPSGRLKTEDIERMTNEALMFKADDDEYKRKVEAKDELERYTFKMRTTLQINGELMGTLDKKKLEDMIKQTSFWLENNFSLVDASAFEERKEKLATLYESMKPRD